MTGRGFLSGLVTGVMMGTIIGLMLSAGGRHERVAWGDRMGGMAQRAWRRGRAAMEGMLTEEVD